MSGAHSAILLLLAKRFLTQASSSSSAVTGAVRPAVAPTSATSLLLMCRRGTVMEIGVDCFAFVVAGAV